MLVLNLVYLALPVEKKVYLAVQANFVVFKIYMGLIIIAYLVNFFMLLARAWPSWKFAAKVAYDSSMLCQVGLNLAWIILHSTQMYTFYYFVFYMNQYSMNLLEAHRVQLDQEA